MNNTKDRLYSSQLCEDYFLTEAGFLDVDVAQSQSGSRLYPAAVRCSWLRYNDGRGRWQLSRGPAFNPGRLTLPPEKVSDNYI